MLRKYLIFPILSHWLSNLIKHCQAFLIVKEESFVSTRRWCYSFESDNKNLWPKSIFGFIFVLRECGVCLHTPQLRLQDGEHHGKLSQVAHGRRRLLATGGNKHKQFGGSVGTAPSLYSGNFRTRARWSKLVNFLV